MTRRRFNLPFFPRLPGDPSPLSMQIQHRVEFHEVDPMGILWHGHYVALMEDASSELRRHCGLSYQAFFKADLRAPVVKVDLEYLLPLRLDERATIRASLVWAEAAKLNIEYEILKENGLTASTGYTIQLFTEGATGEVCFVTPPLLEQCRRRWRAGEFKALQS